jgi:hypothetical protein
MVISRGGLCDKGVWRVSIYFANGRADVGGFKPEASEAGSVRKSCVVSRILTIRIFFV